jgi:hypothetical protein
MYLKQTKSCHISKVATKIGNLELKINMQYVRRAKLGKITRKTTQIKNKNGFFKIGRQKCSPIIVLKQPIDQFCLLSQKMPKIAIIYGQNGKV